MNLLHSFTIVLLSFLLLGCGGKTYTFDLNDRDHEWLAGFADYPEGEEEFYELSSEWKPLPIPLDSLNGIRLTGNNHSDDLFMYIKRELVGLKPNTKYQLSFRLQIATNASSGCIGVGGAPGESVVVKAGVTSYEPIANEFSQGFLRMNVDHGDFVTGGSDAIVVGNLANTQTDCIETVYELKNYRNTINSFEAFTNQE
ncbi:MAG: hypothetical protein COA99_09220, partial [Moraxellaceae bacterium]